MDNIPIDSTLHHGTSIIVFDKAFIARFRKVMVLIKALLFKVPNRVVVSICQEVV